MSAATRCTESIEKEWPGHRVVLSRCQCRNMTTHPSGKCWQHQPPDVRLARWAERQAEQHD